MKKLDALGTRMKGYENISRGYLTPKVPVIIRVDGRAFHTFCRQFDKPFDYHLIDGMMEAAALTAKEMQGFTMGYVQSDEASFLLTDYQDIKTQPWFAYNINKIVSISASLMTINFAKQFATLKNTPVFDSRAFNIPKDDVLNYFLWRAKDWERNSVSMYAQSFFSHNQLLNKGKADMHEMLHSIGKNWATDLTPCEKNGTFIFRAEDGFLWENEEVLPNYQALEAKFSHLI